MLLRLFWVGRKKRLKKCHLLFKLLLRKIWVQFLFFPEFVFLFSKYNWQAWLFTQWQHSAAFKFMTQPKTIKNQELVWKSELKNRYILWKGFLIFFVPLKVKKQKQIDGALKCQSVLGTTDGPLNFCKTADNDHRTHGPLRGPWTPGSEPMI